MPCHAMPCQPLVNLVSQNGLCLQLHQEFDQCNNFFHAAAFHVVTKRADDAIFNDVDVDSDAVVSDVVDVE